jgi:hypothetical protein
MSQLEAACKMVKARTYQSLRYKLKRLRNWEAVGDPMYASGAWWCLITKRDIVSAQTKSR